MNQQLVGDLLLWALFFSSMVHSLHSLRIVSYHCSVPRAMQIAPVSCALTVSAAEIKGLI